MTLLPTPAALRAKFPLETPVKAAITKTRDTLRAILAQQDERLI